MSDAELACMTIKELEDLKARAQAAIRARIRARRQAKLAPSGMAQSRDLQGEFDAWMKGRR